MMQVIKDAGSYAPPGAGAGNHWTEHLRAADLSVGTYSVPSGGLDDQVPHTEDEIYVVTAGQARLEADGESVQVGPGSVIYVAAGEAHRFTDITADLAALVLFAPAEGARAGDDG
jgi:mannose-6-phosphate isomerase-like protein (cupin superfamily)